MYFQCSILLWFKVCLWCPQHLASIFVNNTTAYSEIPNKHATLLVLFERSFQLPPFFTSANENILDYGYPQSLYRGVSSVEQYTIDCEYLANLKFIKIFFWFSHLHFMQLFSADATIFFKKFPIIFFPLKTWKDHPQRLLIIGPQSFFSVLPTGPKPAQISFSVP